ESVVGDARLLLGEQVLADPVARLVVDALDPGERGALGTLGERVARLDLAARGVLALDARADAGVGVEVELAAPARPVADLVLARAAAVDRVAARELELGERLLAAIAEDGVDRERRRLEDVGLGAREVDHVAVGRLLPGVLAIRRQDDLAELEAD